MINYNHFLAWRISKYVVYTESFVLSVNTKDISKEIKNLEDLFDFSNSNKKHEFFSNKNKKVIGIFKIETPKSF